MLKSKYALYTGLTISGLNMAVFLFTCSLIGGSAVDGYSVDGRYYVKNHGYATEVTQGTFFFSKINGYSIWITHPLGVICAAIIGKSKILRR